MLGLQDIPRVALTSPLITGVIQRFVVIIFIVFHHKTGLWFGFVLGKGRRPQLSCGCFPCPVSNSSKDIYTDDDNDDNDVDDDERSQCVPTRCPLLRWEEASGFRYHLTIPSIIRSRHMLTCGCVLLHYLFVKLANVCKIRGLLWKTCHVWGQQQWEEGGSCSHTLGSCYPLISEWKPDIF